jgi:hypothetical protein
MPHAPTIARLAVLAAALAAGCADTFVPASVIADLRVLTLVAEPPELGPPGAGPPQQVTVTARLASPPPGLPPEPTPGDAAAEAWTFCPYTTGASSGYACVVAGCELPLTATARAVTFDPLAAVQAWLALPCVAAAVGASPGTVPPVVPDRVEVLVRFRRFEGSRLEREAVQRIPVWTRTPPSNWTANRLPVIASTTIGASPASPCPDPQDTTACPSSGTATPAAPLAIAVAIVPASVDTYFDGTGRQLTETVVVSFFTTAGRFSQERGEAPSATTSLETKDLAGATEALVWAVARDLRGGQAVVGPFKVAFGP